MKKTLIIASHSYFEQSTANASILNQLSKVSNITVHHLDAIYPDEKIDVTAEQNLLLDAEVVVFQFPLFWYSVPSLMKKWIDEVLSYGFAYGSTGDKLKGKKVVISVTAGGPEEGYLPSGYNGNSVFDLLLPLRQTFNLAQLEYAGLLVSYSMMAMSSGKEAVEQKAEAHVIDLIAKLEVL
ncbi:MAG: NAD(P)H-dependent oxidoreductase [Bacteroidales bacterium]